MNRRTALLGLGALGLGAAGAIKFRGGTSSTALASVRSDKVVKTEEEWRKILSPDALGKADRHVPLRRMRSRSLRLRNQIRQPHGLAELLRSDSRRPNWNERGLLFGLSAHRSALRPL